MSGVGFKILLDLFATSPVPLRCSELPYEFRNRFSGESKLDTMVAWEFFMMLLDHYLGRIVPIRFIAFSLVGLLGLGFTLSCWHSCSGESGHRSSWRKPRRRLLP